MEMQRHALTSQLSLCFAICSDLEMFPSSDVSSCVKRGLLTRTVQGRDGGNRAEKPPMPESSPVLPPSPRCAADPHDGHACKNRAAGSKAAFGMALSPGHPFTDWS